MTITRLRTSLYLGVISLLFATSMAAQNSAIPASYSALVTSLTVETFQQRVQALGFSTNRVATDGKQNTFFTFMAEGRKVAGLVLTPSVVELFISYTDGAMPEDLNEWNRSHFGTTAYIDQKGNAVLRSDLVLDGGVTEKNLDSFVTRFRDAAGAYARFVVEHKKKS